MASKHYEQNKNSLTNEEIYHLCQQSTTAIERKVNHRLTAKNKRAVATVTNGTRPLMQATSSMYFPSKCHCTA